MRLNSDHRSSRHLTLVDGMTSRPASVSGRLQDDERPTLIHVAGSRSSFVRASSIVAAIERRGLFRQHVVDVSPPDDRPSGALLDVLGCPAALQSIAPGYGGHGQRTAHVLASFERVLLEVRPALVLIAGNFEGSLASALAASKLRTPVAHLAAGMRSWDWGSSEEINRVLVDRLSDVLLVHTPEAEANLRQEGIPDARLHYVGNTVADVLRRCEPDLRQLAMWEDLELQEGGYVLVALRQRASVDGDQRAARLVEALARLGCKTPVVLALDARTAAPLAVHGVTAGRAMRGVRCIDPLPFLEFRSLAWGAGAIVTDSGDLEEEASALGVPCYTLRNATQRPVTLTHGTNVLLGDDPAELAEVVPSGRREAPCAIPGWDGAAGERIADVLGAEFALRHGT
jgi:UDP-N-acetylglucosamine 2-epimerase (non-hydrolysing)